MNQYIATFFSHFGAIRYKKICDGRGAKAKIMPVPRSLSSSCGTCVSYENDEYIIDESFVDEIEKIVCDVDGAYTTVYEARE